MGYYSVPCVDAGSTELPETHSQLFLSSSCRKFPKGRETAASRTAPGARLPETLTAFMASGSRDEQICLSKYFSKGKKKSFQRKTLHLKPSFSHLKTLGMLPRNKSCGLISPLEE